MKYRSLWSKFQKANSQGGGKRKNRPSFRPTPEILENRVLLTGAGLLISEFLTNPSGSDSPFEYVELVATRSINFATTPYSVVFADTNASPVNGWVTGGTTTY